MNFAGVGQGDYGFSDQYAPPDTNGAVGATQYVQWVNLSFAVYDKNTGQVVKTFGIIRFNLKGLLKRQDRIIIFLPLGKGNALVVQDIRIIRGEFEGPVVRHNGFKGLSETGERLPLLKKCRNAPPVDLENFIEGPYRFLVLFRNGMCKAKVIP